MEKEHLYYWSITRPANVDIPIGGAIVSETKSAEGEIPEVLIREFAEVVGLSNEDTAYLVSIRYLLIAKDGVPVEDEDEMIALYEWAKTSDTAVGRRLCVIADLLREESEKEDD